MSIPGLYCFRGGDPYSCASGSQFVGCCDIEPCSSGCPADYLHPASFEAAQLGTFPAQQCGSTSAAFYECIHPQASNDTWGINEDTFWGCCLSDACADADCSDLALVETLLSSNTTDAAQYIGLNDTLENSYSSSKYAYSSTSSIAAYLSTSSIPATPSTTILAAFNASTTISSTSIPVMTSAMVIISSAAVSSASPTGVHLDGGRSKDLSAAIGGSVGGLAVLGALALGFIYLLRRQLVSPPPVTTLDAAAAENVAAEKPPNFVDSDASLQSSSQQQYHHAPSYSAAISQRSFTQLPARCFGEQDSQHMTYELPAPLEAELDSGQRYHPYRAS